MLINKRWYNDPECHVLLAKSKSFLALRAISLPTLDGVKFHIKERQSSYTLVANKDFMTLYHNQYLTFKSYCQGFVDGYKASEEDNCIDDL